MLNMIQNVKKHNETFLKIDSQIVMEQYNLDMIQYYLGISLDLIIYSLCGFIFIMVLTMIFDSYFNEHQ